jgi:hypothetical protein
VLARLWRIGRSSFKATLYGINVTRECLQNKIALMSLNPGSLDGINIARNIA